MVNLHRLSSYRYLKALSGEKLIEVGDLPVEKTARNMGELQNWALGQFHLRFVFDKGLPFGGCWSDTREGGFLIPCSSTSTKEKSP